MPLFAHFEASPCAAALPKFILRLGNDLEILVVELFDVARVKIHALDQ